MAVTMRKGWSVVGIACLVLLVLAYSWADGGREPLHPIAEAVSVPELPR